NVKTVTTGAPRLRGRARSIAAKVRPSTGVWIGVGKCPRRVLPPHPESWKSQAPTAPNSVALRAPCSARDHDARDASLADLHDVTAARPQHQCCVIDALTVDAHGALLDLADGFARAGDEPGT